MHTKCGGACRAHVVHYPALQDAIDSGPHGIVSSPLVHFVCVCSSDRDVRFVVHVRVLRTKGVVVCSDDHVLMAGQWMGDLRKSRTID
jgi:hypothetical protein